MLLWCKINEEKEGHAMIQPWTIAVLSTDYDLVDERKMVRSLLKEHNISVSAFEEADFPQLDNLHSHDNCLQVLNRADIAILIINRRYGGRYYLDKEKSITEKEFESAEIPTTVVLVNKDVWTERAIYRNQLKKSRVSEIEFDSTGQYEPTFVESVEIFHFIDRIQGRYETTGKSNWMNFWTDLNDLKEQIPRVLQSLSMNFVQKICKAQIREVKARKTSTAFSMSLGDVIDQAYYMEPDFIVESGTMGEAGNASEQIVSKISSEEDCIIVADAGAGKTTLMAKCFLEKAENKCNPFEFPAYVWLKDKGLNYSFSIQTYLEDCFERYLHKKIYPFFSKENIRFSFFLDGFDELAEKLTKDDLQRLCSSEMFQYPMVLTSRIQYAERYLTSNDFSSKFSCRIRLKEWNEEIARKYIDRFCKLQGKDDAFQSRINSLLIDNADLKAVLKSPLLVTILLYVIEKSRMEIPETVTSRASLFEKSLELLAQREIETKILNIHPIPSNSDLVLHWAYFAWYIYEQKLLGNKGIVISDAEEKIEKLLAKETPCIWPEGAYDAIFDTYDNIAFGTFHEQFLEFLVAYALYYACLQKKYPYPEFLKYVMRPEINRYFRGIVEEKSGRFRETVFNNLYELYLNCAGSCKEDEISMRVHAVYHLSRLQTTADKDIMERIFNIENKEAVLQSLYFGMIKQGDVKREQELYNLLTTNPTYSNANRGYHLAYYDSLPGQKSIPYSDDISCEWVGSLKAFQRHFQSTNIEHFYLRRIDLVTMRQFMEYRKSVGPLSKEILLFFEDQVYHPKIRVDNNEFQAQIEEEYERVKKTFDELA